MTYYVTADSFGSELPENWEEIADRLNKIIDRRGIAEDHDAVNELWEQFWNGDLYRWYIVDDCITAKGEIFTRSVKSREQAHADAIAEWNHLSEHDKNIRDAFYIGYAAVDEEGCVDFDTMTDIEDIRQEG